MARSADGDGADEPSGDLLAFHELDLCRISADSAESNTASHRVLAKAGFTREGCLREAINTAGRRHNTILYGLLRGELEVTSETG